MSILNAIFAALAAIFKAAPVQNQASAPSVPARAPQAPVGAPRKPEEAPVARVPTQAPVAAPEAPRAPVAAPPTTTATLTDSELETVALTVWAEARGEPVLGQVAVAWVIRNRASRPRWWGRSMAEVCLKPYQFSCWLPHDPQSIRLKNPATKNLQTYKAVLAVVKEVMAGKHPDPTKGADHYCTKAVAGITKWAKGATPIIVIGAHNFYRLEA